MINHFDQLHSECKKKQDMLSKDKKCTEKTNIKLASTNPVAYLQEQKPEKNGLESFSGLLSVSNRSLINLKGQLMKIREITKLNSSNLTKMGELNGQTYDKNLL